MQVVELDPVVVEVAQVTIHIPYLVRASTLALTLILTQRLAQVGILSRWHALRYKHGMAKMTH